MPEANFENRTLYQGDNLDFLRGMNSESVHLIATDPPFNKGVKAFEGITAAGENISYKDTWTWGDVQEAWTESIRENHPSLYAVIRAANAAAGEDMGAFLCWLGVRVLEMRRILRVHGSLYLHIDDTAQAWVKGMMDAIFGRENYRNAVVWKRTSSRSDAKRFGRVYDTILYYVKGEGAPTWNSQHTSHDPDYVERFYRFDDEDGRGRWRSADMTAAGLSGGESGQAWRGIDPSDVGRHWSMPVKGGMASYIVENDLIPGWLSIEGVHARLNALDVAGLIHWPAKQGGMPSLKRYLASTSGNAAVDVITDIAPLSARSHEKTGYPTQKPLALYERIVRASSNEGDLVLDPFAGCATTCVAAERLGRQWVGMDINDAAGRVTLDRLEREVEAALNWKSEVSLLKAPPVRTDDAAPAAPELTLVSPKPKAPRLTARELRKRLIDADGMICQGCGLEPHQPEYLESDHKLPKSKGGRDDMRNRVLLCSPCNSVKGNRLTLTELRLRQIEKGWMANKAWDMEWYEREGKF